MAALLQPPPTPRLPVQTEPRTTPTSTEQRPWQVQLAEDLAQETFLRAYRNLDGFRFRSRFSTWLFSIARNAATDALRSRASHRRALDRLARRPTDEGPDPVLAPAMEEALATLSDKLREAIVLVEVAGFTCRDAGEVLGVAEGTIKSRLYHARRHLAAWFSEGGSEGEVATDDRL